MWLAPKITVVGKKSEAGFVLIVALTAIMILMAVGFFALTITSSDLMISSRLLGDRKAFSAAEAGVHDVCITFDPNMAARDNWPIDPTNDPNTTYSATQPKSDPILPSISATGSSIEGGKSWSYNVYDSTITGKDSSYGSSVIVSVGLRHGEVPSTPSYQ
jgi:hypothetical protein